MVWQVILKQDIGGRQEQQDSVEILKNPQHDDIWLLVLADGMGGHKGGALASRIVIEVAKNAWKEVYKGENIQNPRDFLNKICENSHDKIIQAGKKHNLSPPPSSTCVLLYIKNKKAWGAHVGDSRIYHFSRKKLVFRTRDHSVVQMLVDLGRIKESEMASHPDQGRLLKGLGGDKALEPDFFETELEKGDTFILCCDGLWEYVSEADMQKALSRRDFSTSHTVQAFVEKAKRGGGKQGDNISIILARFGSDKSPFPLMRTVYSVGIAGLSAVLLWGAARLFWLPGESPKKPDPLPLSTSAPVADSNKPAAPQVDKPKTTIDKTAAFPVSATPLQTGTERTPDTQVTQNDPLAGVTSLPPQTVALNEKTIVPEGPEQESQTMPGDDNASSIAESSADQTAETLAALEETADSVEDAPERVAEKTKRPPVDPLPPVDPIQHELQICKRYFDKNWLTTGREGNAVDCYQAVLKEQPGNVQASKGIEIIVQRYEGWFYERLSNPSLDNLEKAANYLAALRKIIPHNSNKLKTLTEAYQNTKNRHEIIPATPYQPPAVQQVPHYFPPVPPQPPHMPPAVPQPRPAPPPPAKETEEEQSMPELLVTPF